MKIQPITKDLLWDLRPEDRKDAIKRYQSWVKSVRKADKKQLKREIKRVDHFLYKKKYRERYERQRKRRYKRWYQKKKQLHSNPRRRVIHDYLLWGGQGRIHLNVFFTMRPPYFEVDFSK